MSCLDLPRTGSAHCCCWDLFARIQYLIQEYRAVTFNVIAYIAVGVVCVAVCCWLLIEGLCVPKKIAPASSVGVRGPSDHRASRSTAL